jgi:hypothetical protein
MKKLLLLMMCATIMYATSNAQVKIGVKGGIGISQFVASDIPTHAYIGYYAGGLANFKVNGNFSIQPEAVYSMEGFKAHDPGNDNIRGKDHLGYINVPILVRYTTKGFYAATGPQVGFLLNSKDEIYTNVNGTDLHVTSASTANHNKVVASWAVGVGYQTASKLGFDLRYNLALSKVYSSDATVPTNTSVRNNVFQAGLTYLLK